MNNLQLKDQQFSMGKYLRDPDQISKPNNMDERRVGIYRDLVFNNIESLLSSAFPVINSILTDEQWQALVREFLRDFRAQTPYYTQLSAEFVVFLSQRTIRDNEPAFLIELAHYERIELDLYMLDENSNQNHKPTGSLLDTPLSLSTLAIPLAYQYPVHRIGNDFVPDKPPLHPTFLLLFQDEEQEVRFFELQPLAYQLVLKLAEGKKSSGATLLKEIGANHTTLLQQGEQLLNQLNSLNVIRENIHA